MLTKHAFKFRLCVLLACSANFAYAVDLNYEGLSSLEQPVAFELGDTTFSLNGLLDAALDYNEESQSDSLMQGNFQINAETQLANSWTLGASYFGAYTSESDNNLDEDNYQDNAALFLGGVWGTLAIGNVTELVRQTTRRRRGVGNALLAFDEHLGQLDDYGLAYIGRYGPTQLLFSSDDAGHYELGAMYQRPLGNKDYRFSLRFRESEFIPGGSAEFIPGGGAEFIPDGSFRAFDSKALGFVSELTFGSTLFDLGLGFEQLDSAEISADRAYASLGAARKYGVWTASAEAHLGEIEGISERSYALGLRYDIARGLSLNLGVNYRDAQVDVRGIQLLDQSDTSGRFSLRYSF